MRRLLRHVALEPRQTYDGTQLRPHFILSRFGIVGDAAVIFRGPADVQGGALVDLEDRRAGHMIKSADMLHLIVERFEVDLLGGILLQRLVAAIAADLVREGAGSRQVLRNGDDVRVDGRKLSVSIATVSPTSTLIHFGVNVDPKGAPVPAAGLAELGIDPARFADALLDRIDRELEGVAHARAKVAPAHPGEGQA
jgi:uncharacterized protein